MRKAGLSVVAVLMTILWLLPAQAQAWPGGGEGCKKGKKCSAMHGAMMSMPREMVASGDGVIVLAGTKLYKYDADLNLVKEQTIPVEKSCPYSGKKLCKKGEKGDCGMKCCGGKKCSDCEKCRKMKTDGTSVKSVEDDPHAGHS